MTKENVLGENTLEQSRTEMAGDQVQKHFGSELMMMITMARIRFSCTISVRGLPHPPALSKSGFVPGS